MSAAVGAADLVPSALDRLLPNGENEMTDLTPLCEIGTGTFEDPARNPHDIGEQCNDTRHGVCPECPDAEPSVGCAACGKPPPEPLWLRCCKIDCPVTGETAEIFEIRPAGVRNYEDYTHACVDHIGALIWESLDPGDPSE